ncbi:MAG: sugar phosphate isomerase/epimerase, partial [Acidobacteria bacterium]|nr:sugar phosphate isomerase/epimerase [Acidobacteriota bacterium]
PLNLPIGLQAYTLRNELPGHVPEILAAVAKMGYGEIEIADPFYGVEAKDLAPILKKLKLTAPSGHFGSAQKKDDWQRQMEHAKLLGVRYMVTGFPSEWRDTLDGWKRGGELLNQAGEQCRKNGMMAAYHNHHFEYKVVEGVVAYDQLLKSTDPKLVSMELDTFWTTFAGKDPVEYFEKYPGRFHLLHIKDLKKGYPPSTGGKIEGNPFLEVGQGIMDWKRIFGAARKAGVKHYFVEQDRCDRPPIESIRMSAAYLKKLQ